LQPAGRAGERGIIVTACVAIKPHGEQTDGHTDASDRVRIRVAVAVNRAAGGGVVNDLELKVLNAIAGWIFSDNHPALVGERRALGTSPIDAGR
jgi:hypothetical protein